MLSLWEILLFIGIFVISHIVLWLLRAQKKQRRNDPPSLPSLPLVGSLPFIRGFNNVAEFFMRKSDELGPIFTLKAGNKLVLVLNSKKAIEEAYIGHSKAFSGRKSSFTQSIVNPRTKGLAFVNTSSEWKKYHHLSLSILKELGFGTKNAMETMILREVEAMVDFVRKMNGQQFDPKDTLAMVSGNVISNIILGSKRDFELGLGELFLNVRRILEGADPIFDVAPLVRFLPRYKEKLRLGVDNTNKMKATLNEEIERYINGETQDCFIRRYLEKEGLSFDREQLLFTLRDFIVAGSDTTLSSLQFSLVALANHPEIQDELRSEIDAVVPQERFPSMDDQKTMPFTEATIMEIMRWHTLNPLSLPRVTLKDEHLQGYFIPKGVIVEANLYAAHMNPKEWKDPNAFRPQRFLDENKKVIGKDRIIPFSIGRRSCLGEVLARAELFLIITGLVQRFIILPPDGCKTVDVKPLEPVGLTLIPLAFEVRLLPRS